MTKAASGRKWWRFRGYEIRDGFIRPTANSRLETYDVFEGFTAGGASKGGHAKRPERRPYSGLLELDEVSRRRVSLENPEATIRDAAVAGVPARRADHLVFPRKPTHLSHSRRATARLSIRHDQHHVLLGRRRRMVQFPVSSDRVPASRSSTSGKNA